MPEQASLLTPEQRQRVADWKGELIVFPVERGHVRRFAEAVEDPNPLYADEGAAQRSRYGAIIAPPTFLRAAGSVIPYIPELESFERVLDAGSEWEYEEPVRVGDTITVELRVRNVTQRNLSIGPAVFTTFEFTYRNQLGQVAVRQRTTLIRYRDTKPSP